jgi:ureidoglycolate lyase/seryl-tRNA synthetase
MSGYAEYDIPDDGKEIKMVHLPLVIATKESLQNLGNLVHRFESANVTIVDWPRKSKARPLMSNTGVGPITQGDFKVWWEGDMLHGENHSVSSGLYNIARKVPGSPNLLLTREMNYHPDGGQVIFPKEKKPFIVLLGVPGDNVCWNPQEVLKEPGYVVTKFAAFYFDGSKGLHIHPNVWHQPPIPLEGSLEFFDKQGAVHGCVGYDSIKEDDVWMCFPYKL